MTLFVLQKCDWCGFRLPEAPAPKVDPRYVTYAVDTEGWGRFDGSDDDLCPNCVAARAAAIEDTKAEARARPAPVSKQPAEQQAPGTNLRQR